MMATENYTKAGKKVMMFFAFNWSSIASGPLLTVIASAFGVLVIVVLGISAFGHLKKSVVDMLKYANDALEKGNAALQKENTLLLDKLATMQSGMALQDKRIMLIELESERRQRLQARSTREIQILEKAIQTAVFSLVRSKGMEEQANEVQAVLAELYEYRKEAARDQEEWELMRSSMIAYAETHRDFHIRKTDIAETASRS